MSKGRRYNGENNRKINIKKVIAVIIAILVIIMFIVITVRLIKSNKEYSEKNVILKYYTCYDNGKWGVINSRGENVIECIYDEMILIPNPEKDVFIITYDVDYENNTYKSKAINNKGKQLFEQYDKVEAVQNQDEQNSIFYETGCLKVLKDNKYGLIDFSNKILLNCEYNNIYPVPYIENSLITIKDEKKGLVSATGTVIIENEYTEILALMKKYEDGYIVKNTNNQYGVIGTNKKIIVPVEYEEIEKVNSGDSYVVKKAGGLLIYDSSTKTETPIIGTDVKSINGENIIVKKEGKYGVINTAGEENIEAKYEDLTYISSSYYIAKLNNKYGIIDMNGQIKIDFKYNNLIYRKAADFLEGTTDSKNSDLINKDLEVKLSGIISEINTEKGYIKVRIEEDYEYYNFKFKKKKNTELLTNNTLFLDKKDGKYGYVNKEGVVIVNYIYDDAREQNDCGYIAVKKDEKWGTLDSKGNIIVEPLIEMENNAIIDFIDKWHLAEDINAGYYIK